MVDYKIATSKSPPGARWATRRVSEVFGHIRFGLRCSCRFGVRPDEALPPSEATRDCQFCLTEQADIEERRRKAWRRHIMSRTMRRDRRRGKRRRGKRPTRSARSSSG